MNACAASTPHLERAIPEPVRERLQPAQHTIAVGPRRRRREGVQVLHRRRHLRGKRAQAHQQPDYSVLTSNSGTACCPAHERKPDASRADRANPSHTAAAALLPRSASHGAGHQRRTESSGMLANCGRMGSGPIHATAQARPPCGARHDVRRVRVDQQQLGVQHGRREQRGGHAARRPVQAQALHAPVRRQARADHVLVALVAAQQAVERGALRGGVAGRVARVARKRLRRGLGEGRARHGNRRACARLGACGRRVKPAGPQARSCGRGEERACMVGLPVNKGASRLQGAAQVPHQTCR